MVSLSDSSPVRGYDNSLFSQSPKRTIPLEIRTAHLGDLRGLSEVLVASFYSHQDLLFWLYPLLRLGISEDLRVRLNSTVPYYSCLTAITTVDVSRESPTLPQQTEPTKKVAGTVEITLRSSDKLTNFSAKRTSSDKLASPDCLASQTENCPEYLYISNLAVSPDYRRQGIARELLLSCEPLALQWGYREIYLHVLENNKQAKKLYLNLGYTIDRIEPAKNYWLWSRPQCLLLRKSLAENE